MTDSRYLEVLVHMTRLLLPFTHGIDASAVTSALVLAQRFDATLVLLSLIPLPGGKRREPRYESIQQSRDFLEFAYHKASRSGVPIERIELRTHNPVRSTQALAQELECAGVVLAMRQGTGVLLETSEVKGLLEDKRLSLYVVSLPAKGRLFSPSRWFRKRKTHAMPG
ncbi:MAG TPA: universal stress protein [Ktedonobacteraceae bacterium]|nr:universal stress protein [Ktedonobacteraceae bacterium]